MKDICIVLDMDSRFSSLDQIKNMIFLLVKKYISDTTN